MKRFKNLFYNINGDAFGGVTAGIVALPLALAFGEQTELGAIAGLYGAIIIGVLAAIFGGTKTQISGPTAPMTVISAIVIAEAVKSAGTIDKAIPMIVATFVLAGIFEALFGFLKLGRYTRFIPYPVVSGFMCGIGIIIIVTQVFPFFGAYAPGGGPLGTIQNLQQLPELINIYAVLGAIATIAIIYILPRYTKKLPAALVALVVMTVGAFFLLPEGSILRINSRGDIPTGLPQLQLGFVAVFTNLDAMLSVMKYALTLAALGAIDSLLTSVVADNMTKTKHDSDKELIGQGFGNAIAGLFGGLPGAGSTTVTLINIKSGGKTKISGVIAGLFLLTVLLGIGPLVGFIPNAVLAGILITVGLGIIDYKGLRDLRKIPRADAVVMITVMFLTVWVDLLIAVAVGMVFSSMLFMKKTSEMVEQATQHAELKEFSRSVNWKDEEAIVKRAGDQVYIQNIDGPLFFGFVPSFLEMVRNIPDLQLLVIRLGHMHYVDQSGLYAMEEAIQNLRNRGIQVAFSEVQSQPLEMFKEIGIVPKLVGEQYIFSTFEECTAWLEDAVDEKGKLVTERKKVAKAA